MGILAQNGRLQEAAGGRYGRPGALRRLWIVEGMDWMRERFTAEAMARTFGAWCATYHGRRRGWVKAG